MTESKKFAAPRTFSIVCAVVLVAIFATYIYVYGLTPASVTYCIVAALLMKVAIVDMGSYTIPNIFVVGISLLFFAMLTVETVVGVPMREVVSQATDGLLGSLVVGGGMLLFSVLFDLVTHRMSLGGGDIKLLLAVNLFLGLKLSILALVLSCVFGLIFAAVSGIHKPEMEGAKFSKRIIPFGPSIAAATVLSQLAGPYLLPLLGF